MTFPTAVADAAIKACHLPDGVRGEQIPPEGFVELFQASLPHLEELRATLGETSPVEEPQD
jgi:hypothetical protein